MKKVLIFALSSFILFSVISNTQAGTIMVGAKGWYTEWESAFDKAIADAVIHYCYIEDPAGNYSSTVKPGKGFLAGPLIGYQTDDNLWSFSAAFMFINLFKSDTDWDFNGYELKTKTKMRRNDYDMSVSYMLLDFMKVFAGFKYVKSTYDVDIKNPAEDFYKAEMTCKIPTAGIALGGSLTDSIVLGIQLGIMYIIPDYKYEGEKLKADNSIGYTVEPNLSFLISENFMLQTGVRYQIYNAKFNDTKNDLNVTKNDQMLGVTASAVFMF